MLNMSIPDLSAADRLNMSQFEHNNMSWQADMETNTIISEEEKMFAIPGNLEKGDIFENFSDVENEDSHVLQQSWGVYFAQRSGALGNIHGTSNTDRPQFSPAKNEENNAAAPLFVFRSKIEHDPQKMEINPKKIKSPKARLNIGGNTNRQPLSNVTNQPIRQLMTLKELSSPKLTPMDNETQISNDTTNSERDNIGGLIMKPLPLDEMPTITPKKRISNFKYTSLADVSAAVAPAGGCIGDPPKDNQQTTPIGIFRSASFRTISSPLSFIQHSNRVSMTDKNDENETYDNIPYFHLSAIEDSDIIAGEVDTENRRVIARAIANNMERRKSLLSVPVIARTFRMKASNVAGADQSQTHRNVGSNMTPLIFENTASFSDYTTSAAIIENCERIQNQFSLPSLEYINGIAMSDNGVTMIPTPGIINYHRTIQFRVNIEPRNNESMFGLRQSIKKQCQQLLDLYMSQFYHKTMIVTSQMGFDNDLNLCTFYFQLSHNNTKQVDFWNDEFLELLHKSQLEIAAENISFSQLIPIS